MIIDISYGTFEQGHAYIGSGFVRSFHSVVTEAAVAYVAPRFTITRIHASTQNIEREHVGKADIHRIHVGEQQQ